MNDNLKNWLKDLKKINELYTKKQDCEDIISCKFDDYLRKHNVIQPQKKQMQHVPLLPNASYKALGGMGIFCIILAITFIALIGLLRVWSIVLSVGSIVTGIICFIATQNSKENYRLALEKREKIIKKNEEARDFNNNQYNKLMATYNTKSATLRVQYNESLAESKNKLKVINAELDTLKDILHPKYHQYIADITDIVEEGRADSKKEAISVLLDDINRWQQQQEQIEHNKRMEEYAEMQTQIQAELAQAQAEAAYRQANAAEESARNTEEMRKEIEKSFRK